MSLQKNMGKLKMNRITFLERHPTNVTEISPVHTKIFVYNLAIVALYNDVLLALHVIQAGVTAIPIR